MTNDKTLHTCNELGACQERVPPCAGCQGSHLPAQPWVGQRTPAPAICVMQHPVYQPSRGPYIRPGAADFLAVSSVGMRC